jgi:hypothetical protein
LQFGAAFEFPLAPSDSSRDITRFRLTFDAIFRYRQVVRTETASEIPTLAVLR